MIYMDLCVAGETIALGALIRSFRLMHFNSIFPNSEYREDVIEFISLFFYRDFSL